MSRRTAGGSMIAGPDPLLFQFGTEAAAALSTGERVAALASLSLCGSVLTARARRASAASARGETAPANRGAPDSHGERAPRRRRGARLRGGSRQPDRASCWPRRGAFTAPTPPCRRVRGGSGGTLFLGSASAASSSQAAGVLESRRSAARRNETFRLRPAGRRDNRDLRREATSRVRRISIPSRVVRIRSALRDRPTTPGSRALLRAGPRSGLDPRFPATSSCHRWGGRRGAATCALSIRPRALPGVRGGAADRGLSPPVRRRSVPFAEAAPPSPFDAITSLSTARQTKVVSASPPRASIDPPVPAAAQARGPAG